MRRHAPVSEAVLAGPADPGTIAAAEAKLGLTLPTELVESLRRHNGLAEWANIMPGAMPLSAAQMVAYRQMRMQAASEGGWWHELWLPFGDAFGDAQFIDLRPGPSFLRLGIAPHHGTADFSDAWPSLGAYLTAAADALESGGAAGAWHPYLTAKGELWWSFAGATELNGEPLRPAPPI
jgi:cell wall assembly regulator SMI1